MRSWFRSRQGAQSAGAKRLPSRDLLTPEKLPKVPGTSCAIVWFQLFSNGLNSIRFSALIAYRSFRESLLQKQDSKGRCGICVPSRPAYRCGPCWEAFTDRSNQERRSASCLSFPTS